MERMERNVTEVTDGDTFKTDRGERVRLEDVDAPESYRVGGPEARRDLEDLILGKRVTIDQKAIDDYGRIVAQVRIGELSVNEEMQRKLKWRS